MKKSGKQNLQTFILTRILLIIITFFLLVFLALNIFLRVYIITGTREQLKNLIAEDDILVSKKEQHDAMEKGDEEIGEVTKGPLGAKGNVFIYSADGSIADILHGNEDAVEEIVAYFVDHPELDLDTLTNLYVAGNIGIYYVSSKVDMIREEAWAIYYVDVTSVMQFYWAVLRTLLILLLVSVLIAVICTRWMTNELTEKVKSLSEYATQIGEGSYDAPQPEFTIYEFDDLFTAMGRMAAEIDHGQKQQIAFFQNVSHELRTPLMSIRCYAEGIQYGVMDPRQSSEIILEEIDLLSGMVEDILYISRIDRNLQNRRLEELDLREIISSCVTSQRKLAETKGILFEFHFDDTPVLFNCSEEDIERLCSNLLSNAIRYAKQKITLECRDTGERILIALEDDGEGICEEDLPHIFDRFYKGRGGVHGIGLSIVKSVADFYGGCTQVRNVEGARFEITLPK